MLFNPPLFFIGLIFVLFGIFRISVRDSTTSFAAKMDLRFLNNKYYPISKKLKAKRIEELKSEKAERLGRSSEIGKGLAAIILGLVIIFFSIA